MRNRTRKYMKSVDREQTTKRMKPTCSNRTTKCMKSGCRNRSTKHTNCVGRNRRSMWPNMIRLAICAAAVVVFLLILTGPVSDHFFKSKAAIQPELTLSEVQYKVIQIKKGDSLWSIANDNMGPGYSDIYAYIKDIKECNQLDSNCIRAGNYLLIPYYEYVSQEFAAAP